MDRSLIDSFEIKFKSAFRNLKSAILMCAMLFALSFSADAQQSGKAPRIGYLSSQSFSANSTRIKAFRQGLRELEYVEWKNIVVEYRHAERKHDGLPALAAELVFQNGGHRHPRVRYHSCG